MIFTIVPYSPASSGMNLGFAYNAAMERLRQDDWACFLDHDACFTTYGWYRQLEAISGQLKDPCVLTAMTNRVGSPWQVLADADPNNHSMEYHRSLGKLVQERFGNRIRDVTDLSLMSGVVILLSKRTWRILGGFPDGFLGVDNHIHQAARARGYRVFLMEGVYVYHWYRADGIGPADLAVRTPATRAESNEDKALPHWTGSPAPLPLLEKMVPPTARRVAKVVIRSAMEDQNHHTDQTFDAAGAPIMRLAADLDGNLLESRDQCDCVLVGDAPAKVRRPLSLLRQLRERLSTDGRLVGYLANARHHRRIGSLLDGIWLSQVTAEEPPPIRCFTKREIEKLLYRSGFEFHQIVPIGLPRNALIPSKSDNQLRIGSLCVSHPSAEVIQEFQAEYFLFSASPAPRQDFGLTSIVIATHDQLAYTRQCLDSIRNRTDEDYELIVIDNGSTDGTVEYLKSMSSVRLIINSHNRGFPAAANQGIEASRGRQILLLNNDTIVTTGWLGRMLRAAYRDDGVGLVGPLSNHVSGEQAIPVSYTSLESLDGFAWELGKSNGGQVLETNRLVGFCLLIKRGVIERVGKLDERFGIGTFEDDDLTLRAVDAGYKAVIAQDAFVHHFGSQTFRGSGIDMMQLMQANAELLRRKRLDNC